MEFYPDQVRITPYNPAWPLRYETERHALAVLFANTASVIEHVGSTAVVGLGAKPIIDIMVGVPVIEVAEAQIEALQAYGYAYVPEFEGEIAERRFFRKSATGAQQFHLHCVCADSEFFRHHILFREILRWNPSAARDYLQLKLQLAEQFPDDRRSYTQAKAEFIDQLVRDAELDNWVQSKSSGIR